MRMLLLLGFALAAAPAAAAQHAPQDRGLCTHATSNSGAYCPRPGPPVKVRMRRFDAVREQQELRLAIDTALAVGDCAAARKIAVDKGHHELAARIRRACRAQS